MRRAKYRRGSSRSTWIGGRRRIIAAVATLVAFGGIAILLARKGRRNIERTIGRAGGAGSARVGRLLGMLGVCVGLTAAVALGVYGLLNYFG